MTCWRTSGSDIEGAEDAVMEFCASPKSKRGLFLTTTLQQQTKQIHLNKTSSSNISAPRPCCPVRHGARCMTLPLVHGTTVGA